MKNSKLIKKLFVAGMLSFLPITSLTACNAFFGEEGYVITDVSTAHYQDEGYTLITITFSDETVEPISFKIYDGDEGNGIKDITAQANGDFVTLTVIYTDTNKDPLVINVPIIQGRGVDSISATTNTDGNTELVFRYTDGTQSDPIVIKNGKDGEGIANITVTADADLNVVVTIYFTDSSKEPLTFTIRRAAYITEIKFDETNSTDETFVFIVYFSDGDVKTFTMPAPKAGKDGSKWHHAAYAPSEEDGKVGDFWINVLTGAVYIKEQTGWTKIFIFNLSSSESENVKADAYLYFFADGATFTDESKYRIVEVGKTLPLANFPEDPTMENYEFIGWYTHPTSVNAGKFTDLTIVTQNTNLYARWSKIN